LIFKSVPFYIIYGYWFNYHFFDKSRHIGMNFKTAKITDAIILSGMLKKIYDSELHDFECSTSLGKSGRMF